MKIILSKNKNSPQTINLIHHLTNPFEQEMYTDEYKEALTELIEEKIEQQEKNGNNLSCSKHHQYYGDITSKY